LCGQNFTFLFTEPQVRLSLRLGLAFADLTDAIKLKFRQQMAVAAGLAAVDFPRVTATFAAVASQRRLLQGSIIVDVAIDMADQATASAAVASLTAENIRRLMDSAGIPGVLVVSPAVVVPLRIVLPGESALASFFVQRSEDDGSIY
jgi:hypothetical protein